MSRMIIEIAPALKCQYREACPNLAHRAVIWSNGLLPIRWTMIPVCDRCAAPIANPAMPIVPDSRNYVNAETEK